MRRLFTASGPAPRVALSALALTMGLLVAPASAQAQVTRFHQEVYDSIQGGLEYLRRVGVRTGGRYVHRNGRGMDGIAAMVFLDQPRSPDPRDGFSGFRGMPPLDRVAVVRMLRACIDEENTLRASGNSVFLSTYSAGQCLMGLARARASGSPHNVGAGLTVDQAIEVASTSLVDSGDPQRGGWSYGGPGMDMSASHFGWMGLSAARVYHADVIDPYMRDSARIMRQARNLDGGLKYTSVGCSAARPCPACPEDEPDCVRCVLGYCQNARSGWSDSSHYLWSAGPWMFAMTGVPLNGPDRQLSLRGMRDNFADVIGSMDWLIAQVRNFPAESHTYTWSAWTLIKGLDASKNDGSGDEFVFSEDIGGVRDPVALGYPDTPRSYYFDIAYYLLRTQQEDGRWNQEAGPELGTIMALLALERSLGGACLGGDPDGDLVCDEDNCPNTHNPDQSDVDRDGVGDVCDPCPWSDIEPSGVDTDEDGHDDICDLCLTVFNPRQLDGDEDGVGDNCDNCLHLPNPDQADADDDDWGDLCDNCPEAANPDQFDVDDNGIGDWCQCVESEPCDGRDNDCDGEIDEAGTPPDLCETEFPGICGQGTEICVDGAIDCRPTDPVFEICDGLDNDCDGVIDDMDEIDPCDTGEVGECGPGDLLCVDAELVCTPLRQPSAEICDGRDNNCNGVVDEGNPGGGRDCSDGRQGVCIAWRMACVDGALRCDETPPIAAELCNEIDDDCDGRVDEGNPESRRACETEGRGICRAGLTSCIEGAVGCVQTRQPEAEKCNQLDDDCDGVYDEIEAVGRPCYTRLEGVCADGLTQCVRGANECIPSLEPGNELCDGLDNDCDGTVDELEPGAGEVCETGWGGACAMGLTACDGGRIRCLPEVTAAREACDGVDQDCDGLIDEGARSACGGCLEEPPEECDGRDQDCDGFIDENAPCGDGTLCRFGGCQALCPDEGCADGEICLEGLCVDPCDGVACAPGETCQSGRCLDPCERVSCRGGERCLGGECVDAVCRPGECPEGFACVDARCVADPCFGLSCPLTLEGWIQLCRDGECVPSCALRQCPPDELCVDGRCETDPCLDVECAEGQICYDARCVDQCGECAEGTVCVLGACRPDPCATARCAPAERCVLDHRGNAQCETNPDYMGQPTPPPLDAGLPDAAPTPPDAAPPPPDAAPVPPMDADLDAAPADAATLPSQTEGEDGGCGLSTGEEQAPLTALLCLIVVLYRPRPRP